jgi:hypothetical protein
MIDHANLPRIDNARLPEVYESAKKALANCARLDECQQWADKAEALASYARQAEDVELRKMADRIQARAIRRCGELLKQIDAQQGARTDVQPREGAHQKLTRTEAAIEAGLSEHQRKTALRVANVPESEFEEALGANEPPTVTALAKAGTKPKKRQLVDLKGRDPGEYNYALHFVGGLKSVLRELQGLDLDRMHVLTKEERQKVGKLVAEVDAMADKIATRI